MWISQREATSARRAASEFRKIANYLERIGVDPEGRAHPEIKVIADNLTAIRKELAKTGKRRNLSEDGRQVVADGFNSIGNAMRGNS